jgi:hypothetical protein
MTAAGRAAGRAEQEKQEHLLYTAKEAIQSSHYPGKNEPVASSVGPLCPVQEVRNTESPVSMLRNIESGVRNTVLARSATGIWGHSFSYSWSAPQRRQAGGGAENR